MINTRTLRILWTFYNSFFVSTLVLTASCAYMCMVLGPGALTLITWFKIITSGIIIYYINNYKNKEFYYYQNLGLSKKILWSSTMTVDFLIYIFAVYLSFQIENPII